MPCRTKSLYGAVFVIIPAATEDPPFPPFLLFPLTFETFLRYISVHVWLRSVVLQCLRLHHVNPVVMMMTMMMVMTCSLINPVVYCEWPYNEMFLQGSVFFPLPDGQGLMYCVSGTAEPPKPNGKVSRDVPCKTTFVETLAVQNWLKKSQRSVAVWFLMSYHSLHTLLFSVCFIYYPTS